MRADFDEIRDRLDQALASDGGVSILFPSGREAKAFRMALYTFRRQDTRHNATMYPEDHALHSSSIYDTLLVRLEGATVLIEPRRPLPPAKPLPPDQARPK